MHVQQNTKYNLCISYTLFCQRVSTRCDHISGK